MVFYLSKRPMMDRHTAVSLPYNTETIDSPMEGVIRVNLFHFAGGTGKKPSFDIHKQAVPEDRLSSEYDEEAQEKAHRYQVLGYPAVLPSSHQ